MNFEISVLGRTDTSVLLWATRRGASGIFDGISTVGIWHFVEVSDDSGSVSTRQWHIPRYKLVDRVVSLRRIPDDFGAAASLPIVYEVDSGISLVMVEPGVIHFGLRSSSGTTVPMPGPMVDLLQEDVQALEAARAEVRERPMGGLELPGAETPSGGPVCSSSDDLIAAVAFEWLREGGLFVADFGIYSAHCTCSDFLATETMGDDLIVSLASGALAQDARESRPTVRQWYAEAERRLFSSTIWSEYTRTPTAERSEVISAAMASLTRTQRVQFVLMNGMQGADVIMPLALLSGVITFEQYADTRCDGLRPDSMDEQDIRKVTAWAAGGIQSAARRLPGDRQQVGRDASHSLGFRNEARACRARSGTQGQAAVPETLRRSPLWGGQSRAGTSESESALPFHLL